MSGTFFTNNHLKAWHIRLSFKQQQGKSHCLRTSQVTNTAQNRKRIPKTTSWVDCCQKSKFLQYRLDPYGEEKIFHKMIFIFFFEGCFKYLFILKIIYKGRCIFFGRTVRLGILILSCVVSIPNLLSLVTNNDMNSKSFQNCLTDTQKNLCQAIFVSALCI